MRILILANNSGGLYTFRHELIEELSSTADIYASTPFDDKTEALQAIGISLIETPISRRSMNPIQDLALFRTYRRLLKKIRPDLVITYTIKPNVYGGLACRLAGLPYAANITGLGTTFQKDSILKKLVTYMYKIALKKARCVLFENSENRQIFIDSGIIMAEKTHLLNGAGVNLRRFQPAEYPSGQTVRFLFIGRVMQEKGINELFSAMDRLIRDGLPVHLDIVGRFEEDYQASIELHTFEGWLTYHGFQEDVRPFIAASHCFVLPSWHEGMANTNLECAAMARPVITSKIHGCLEAVEDGVSGYLCEKQNADDLYRVMKRFAALSPEDREAMGLAGRKRMEALFDKEKVVAETLDTLGLAATCRTVQRL